MKPFRLLLMLSLFLTAQEALACSCALNKKSVVQRVSDYDRVVFGMVVDQMQVGSDRRITLDVTETFKGTSEKRVAVYTAQNSAACGFPFQDGEQYLVFMSEDERGFSTGLCSGNLEGESADTELQRLRDHTKHNADLSNKP